MEECPRTNSRYSVPVVSDAGCRPRAPSYPDQTRGCPSTIIDSIVFFTKLSIFLSACCFVLFLPLGDPDSKCGVENSQDGSLFTRHDDVYIYLCHVHGITKEVSKQTVDVFQKTFNFMFCVLLNALYDVKMKFYYVLGKLDREDLCRACAQNGGGCKQVDYFETQTIVEKAGICRCTNCKCTRAIKPTIDNNN